MFRVQLLGEYILSLKTKFSFSVISYWVIILEILKYLIMTILYIEEKYCLILIAPPIQSCQVQVCLGFIEKFIWQAYTNDKLFLMPSYTLMINITYYKQKMLPLTSLLSCEKLFVIPTKIHC